MCKFMSAWVSRTGEVFFDENVDSHEDIAGLFNLHADNGLHAVRVEYVPDFSDLNLPFQFKIDEETTPEWFDLELQGRTKDFLQQRFNRMCIREDRRILAGGRYILVGQITIGKLVNCAIQHAGDATIKDAGHATIQHADRATIKDAGRATIQDADRATIKDAGRATIQDAGDAVIRNAENATIINAKNATIQYANNTIIQNANNATILDAGRATIQDAGYATIQNAGNAVIQHVNNAVILAAGKAIFRNNR